MPEIEVNGTRLYYEDTGQDGTGWGSTGQTIVFSHGLLWDAKLFAPQLAHLKSRYRVIAYDHRGQGRSADDTASSISMETVYQDAVALIEKLGIGPVHFAGLSMGGFVAMRLGARRPDLVRSLILMETSADPEPPENVPKYRKLNVVARWLGLSLVAGKVMPIMFSEDFLTDPARAAERAHWRGKLVGNRRSIWRAVNGVIDRAGVHDELDRIRCPVLVVVGEQDVATVPAKAERIHAAIPHSRLVRIAKAGHSSSVEQPAAVNAALDGFLKDL